jgi:hypothetical protein
MQKLLPLILIIFLFTSCNNSDYRKNTYTKTRVQRVGIANNKISKEKPVPTSGYGLSSPKKEVVKSVQYHIIAASSTNKKTAKSLIHIYKRYSKTSKLISSNGRFRISIASFNNMKEAKENKEKYAILLKKNDLWVFKN